MINRGPRSYVMAVDDTELSTRYDFDEIIVSHTQHVRGLDILLRLLNPRDSLICVHFYPSDNDIQIYEAMKQRIENDLEEFGPVNSSFQLIEKDRGKALTHCLVDYVEESECDVFAIAPRATQALSSLSEYVVNHVSCNIFLCKN